MRLIRLALALVAVSSTWAAAAANPALNNSVIGTASTTAATQVVAGAAQGSRLDGVTLGGEPRRSLNRASSAGSRMNDSVPSGWLMALVTVLLIGHQLRRKHRFLRPQRFSNL
jgi:hypothetical protein